LHWQWQAQVVCGWRGTQLVERLRLHSVVQVFPIIVLPRFPPQSQAQAQATVQFVRALTGQTQSHSLTHLQTHGQTQTHSLVMHVLPEGGNFIMLHAHSFLQSHWQLQFWQQFFGAQVQAQAHTQLPVQCSSLIVGHVWVTLDTILDLTVDALQVAAP
jgi:hypothetical protein